ncbi:MAG: hypothetical protein A2711_14545 [Burkholderiales bacterium RIFCSPHIGHO2_01_FULL_63_240]|jgi:hypothetical protein|nr:MAG: hypothetical protein A2711_14545 [Burkholderiales bacterium RIFCSPHIGHO2_01_FULL_63_240]
MVTLDATVECVEDKYFLKINVEQGPVTIPLSDDNPNAVKSAFNKLIKRIRIGEFTVKLDKVGEDLFSMVANEYLAQLNREIQEVHSQMQEYGLVKMEQAR